VGSDAQNCVVDVFDPLVGPGKTIAGVVDLLLGEILDHEEVEVRHRSLRAVGGELRPRPRGRP
jgi:sorbitol-specific phosphotransferase system component IIBC